jgi:hypothetical protein
MPVTTKGAEEERDRRSLLMQKRKHHVVSRASASPHQILGDDFPSVLSISPGSPTHAIPSFHSPSSPSKGAPGNLEQILSLRSRMRSTRKAVVGELESSLKGYVSRKAKTFAHAFVHSERTDQTGPSVLTASPNAGIHRIVHDASKHGDVSSPIDRRPHTVAHCSSSSRGWWSPSKDGMAFMTETMEYECDDDRDATTDESDGKGELKLSDLLKTYGPRSHKRPSPSRPRTSSQRVRMQNPASPYAAREAWQATLTPSSVGKESKMVDPHHGHPYPGMFGSKGGTVVGGVGREKDEDEDGQDGTTFSSHYFGFVDDKFGILSRKVRIPRRQQHRHIMHLNGVERRIGEEEEEEEEGTLKVVSSRYSPPPASELHGEERSHKIRPRTSLDVMRPTRKERVSAHQHVPPFDAESCKSSTASTPSISSPLVSSGRDAHGDSPPIVRPPVVSRKSSDPLISPWGSTTDGPALTPVMPSALQSRVFHSPGFGRRSLAMPTPETYTQKMTGKDRK